MADLISLDRVKAQLNLDGTGEDVELGGYVAAVTQVITEYLGRPVVTESIVDEPHTVPGHGALWLRRWPVQALTSIERADGTFWVLSDLRVNADTGKVYGRSGTEQLGGGELLVSYVAGPVVPEPSHTLAAAFMVQHLYESQRIAAAGPQPTFGGQEVVLNMPAGTALTQQVLELLGPSAVMV